MIGYAGVIAMETENEAHLKATIERMQTVVENDYYVGINKEKTEVKVSEKEGDSTVQIILNGDTLENVKRFKYLGSRVTKNGRSERKIQFCEARSKKRLFTSNDISWITRKRLLKAFVWRSCLLRA